MLCWVLFWWHDGTALARLQNSKNARSTGYHDAIDTWRGSVNFPLLNFTNVTDCHVPPISKFCLFIPFLSLKWNTITNCFQRVHHLWLFLFLFLIYIHFIWRLGWWTASFDSGLQRKYSGVCVIFIERLLTLITEHKHTVCNRPRSSSFLSKLGTSRFLSVLIKNATVKAAEKLLI